VNVKDFFMANELKADDILPLIAKLSSFLPCAVKNTMVKTLQTMVSETDTLFFAAITVVFEVGTMVFFTDTMVPIPETMVFAMQKIFFVTETIVPVANTMVSAFDTMVFVSQPMVPVSNTIANASNTMVHDANQIIEKIRFPSTLDFYHGICFVYYGH